MAEVPPTQPSLIVRIRDAGDAEAWAQFVRVYAPVIYRYARGRGLQDADAADLSQDVLRSVAVAVRRFDYDRERGRFRGWLFTLAHHRLRDWVGRNHRQVQGTGDSGVKALLDQQPAGDPAEAAWQEEYERQLFRVAAERVRACVEDSTWRAFWLTSVEGQNGRQVAEALGVSQAAVYLAKSRVLVRLRQEIRHLEDG
jgi:RNA polymerase sigma factor (sigma-70 family)